MANKRLPTRKIKEVLRLKYSCGLSDRQIALSCVVSRSTVSDLMMTHFAIRGLMHEAAIKGDIDPDKLSFVHAIRVVRRKLRSLTAFSPSAQESTA